MRNMLKQRDIKLFATNSERKASVVERFNRTMKGLTYKYLTHKNTHKYINLLPELVEKYNNSYHRSIKMKPNQVNKLNVPLVWMNLYEGRLQPIKKIPKSKHSLNIGDTVRIRK